MKGVHVDPQLNLVLDGVEENLEKEKSLQALDLMKNELYSGTCDLHILTAASNGSDSVGAIITKVLQHGLHAFAITDKDSMEGVESMEIIVDKLLKMGIAVPHFIRGIELTLDYQGQNIPLLAYFPKGYGEQLPAFLESQRKQRETRNQEICKRLNDLGIPISYQEVQKTSSYVLGRTHFAKVLSRQGYAATPYEAYKQWLDEGRAAFVPSNVPSVEEGIKVVREAGGVPVLGFKAIKPWLDKGFEYVCEQFIYLKGQGLLGVQPVHGHAHEYEINYIIAAAKQVGLDLFSGSGYKGYHDLNIDMFRKEMDFSRFIS